MRLILALSFVLSSQPAFAQDRFTGAQIFGKFDELCLQTAPTFEAGLVLGQMQASRANVKVPNGEFSIGDLYLRISSGRGNGSYSRLCALLFDRPAAEIDPIVAAFADHTAKIWPGAYKVDREVKPGKLTVVRPASADGSTPCLAAIVVQSKQDSWQFVVLSYTTTPDLLPECEGAK